MPVTAIDHYAFYYDYDKDPDSFLSKITSITISEGIKSIGDVAFGYMSSLEIVQLPNSLEYLGDNAFSGCIELVGRTYNNLQYVGSVSNPCMVLIPTETNKEASEVFIDERCKFITSYAFKGYTNLTEVVIPDNVISIASRVFYMCTKLTNVTLPENLIYIGESVFRASSKIKYTTYEGGSYLGSKTNPYFLLCVGSSGETLTIHEKCKLIASSAFEKNYSLKAVDLSQYKYLINGYLYDIIKI